MKAFLGWPVKLINRKDNLHITLKYFGDVSDLPCADMSRTDCDPVGDLIAALTERFKGQPVDFPAPEHLDWECGMFGPKRDVFGMELMMRRSSRLGLNALRDSLDDLKQNDYLAYRPHISVSRELWCGIKRQDPTPYELIESIGPLTLFVKDGDQYQGVHTWK